MSEESRSPAVPVLGLLLTGVSLLYVFLLHHGLGPVPDALDPPWYAPRGFLFDALADGPLAFALADASAGVWLFALPSLLLLVAVFATTRSAVARGLAASALVAALLFGFYGIASTPRLIWAFFHWRGSLTMAATALAVGFAAVAPWMAASWLRRGWPLRVGLYLPVFVLVVALVRNTTGTDPALPFSVSPWPAISVFGLEVGAAGLAAQFAGIAIGVGGLALALRRTGTRAAAIGAGAVAAGIAFPTLSLAVGAAAGLLPFRVDAGRLAAAALLCLAGIVVTALMRSGLRAELLARRARAVGVGALLVGAPLLIGQLSARSDYTTTRDARAQPLIDALAAYYERESLYPDSLDELIASGDLKQLPEPRIGFAVSRSERFAYQSFGVGYVLEFSAPRWVQCAYSPPWEEVDEEDAALAREETLADEPDVAAGDEPEFDFDDEEAEGWTCPSKPPELW